jgi:hypothetical protein
MSKIKEIHDRLLKDPKEYSEIRLLVAKRSLAFFLALYYTVYLFTIGGFEFGPLHLSTLSQITYHTYTILVIMLAWFIYEFSVYTVHVYFDDKRWLIIIGLFLSIAFAGFALFTHFL